MPPTLEELESMCARRVAEVRNGSVDRYGVLDIATVLLLTAGKLSSLVSADGAIAPGQRDSAASLLEESVAHLHWLSENVQTASDDDIRCRLLAADDALLRTLRELR